MLFRSLIINPHYCPTYFFTNEEEALSHPSRLLNLLPTHPSHLLLYPLTDTPQEMFQHIHSVNCNPPHKIICLFQLRPQTPVLSFQLLILLLQALILVFKVQHLFKVCFLPVTGISIPEVIDKFFCKLRFLNCLIRIFFD